MVKPKPVHAFLEHSWGFWIFIIQLFRSFGYCLIAYCRESALSTFLKQVNRTWGSIMEQSACWLGYFPTDIWPASWTQKVCKLPKRPSFWKSDINSKTSHRSTPRSRESSVPSHLVLSWNAYLPLSSMYNGLLAKWDKLIIICTFEFLKLRTSLKQPRNMMDGSVHIISPRCSSAFYHLIVMSLFSAECHNLKFLEDIPTSRSVTLKIFQVRFQAFLVDSVIWR